jgi:hypothetical protein
MIGVGRVHQLDEEHDDQRLVARLELHVQPVGAALDAGLDALERHRVGGPQVAAHSRLRTLRGGQRGIVGAGGGRGGRRHQLGSAALGQQPRVLRIANAWRKTRKQQCNRAWRKQMAADPRHPHVPVSQEIACILCCRNAAFNPRSGVIVTHSAQ